MRKFALILLLSVSSVLFGITAFSQDDIFTQGVELFSQGNTQEALDQWMTIYNQGFRSAALCYNIGNAQFKLSNIPEAILFYERGLLLKPGDEDINYNLGIARTFVVDRFDEIPELFFVRWYNLVSLSLSSDKWAITSMATFISFLILISIFIYSSGYRLKIISFWCALGLFLLSSLSFAFSFRNRELVYNSGKAIIMSSVVNGKSSPDNSGTDLFVLHEGTKVTIEDELGNWVEVRLSDGNKGWVGADCLNKI
jgi:hypothetical protein